MTQQFSLSIFTDFRYQSIKITDLIATDFYRLTTPRLVGNWMTFWNSDPLERKYSVGIIYIGKWVSVDRWQFSEPEVGQLCEMAILKKKCFSNIVGQKLVSCFRPGTL